MNAKDIALALNGEEYPLSIGATFRAEAKASGLVIVYGASDDLMEFDGAVHDEIGAYEGATAYLDSTGLLENDCDNDECPHFEKLKVKAATIEALWDPGEGYSWKYQTAIPHETFEIVEDGEPYCRGIVFALADVARAQAQ